MDLTLASRQPLDVAVVAKRLDDPRITTPLSIGAPAYEITQPGDPEPARRREQLADPGPPAGAGRHPGRVERRRDPRAQPDGQHPVPHQRRRAARGRDAVRPERRPEPAAGAVGDAPHRRPARRVRPADHRASSTSRPRAARSSRAATSGCTAAASPGSSRVPSTAARVGRFSYFVTADYLQNSIGISPATPGRRHPRRHAAGARLRLLRVRPRRDEQGQRRLRHLRRPLPDPEQPGRRRRASPSTACRSSTPPKIDETQLEQNYFAVLSYRRRRGSTACRSRRTRATAAWRFHPDPLAGPPLQRHRPARGPEQHRDRPPGRRPLRPHAEPHAPRRAALRGRPHQRRRPRPRCCPPPTASRPPTSPSTSSTARRRPGYTYSVYLQDEWQLLPSVTLNVGLRLDGYDAFRSEWQLSPRVNVVWRPTSTTTVHAGYARYFTPPRQEFISSATLAKFANTTAAPEVTQNSAAPRRARQLRRRRRHPADPPRPQGRPRRLLQAGRLPARRGPVRRAGRSSRRSTTGRLQRTASS